MHTLSPQKSDGAKRRVGNVLALSELSPSDHLIDKKGGFAHVTVTALLVTGTKTVFLAGMLVVTQTLNTALQDLESEDIGDQGSTSNPTPVT